jgi:ubiquitin-protein ligase
MEDLRLRRLLADFREVTSRFRDHPYIEVRPEAGDPPHLYRVHYRVAGITRLDARGQPLLSDSHTVMIDLHSSYPRMKPRCVAVTPLFHPNIGNTIALGDTWDAAGTLGDVIVQIGQMIQLQSYNPRAPLNPVALKWATANEFRFPVGAVDLSAYDSDVDVRIDGTAAEPLEVTLDREDEVTLGQARAFPPPGAAAPPADTRTETVEQELERMALERAAVADSTAGGERDPPAGETEDDDLGIVLH